MSLIKEIRDIKTVLLEIKAALTDDTEISELEKEYKEYKFFADARGMKMLSDKGLLDEYNEFMSECETVLFGDAAPFKIELPKPSSALEAFKNKFNKFF